MPVSPVNLTLIYPHPARLHASATLDTTEVPIRGNVSLAIPNVRNAQDPPTPPALSVWLMRDWQAFLPVPVYALPITSRIPLQTYARDVSLAVESARLQGVMTVLLVIHMLVLLLCRVLVCVQLDISRTLRPPLVHYAVLIVFPAWAPIPANAKAVLSTPHSQAQLPVPVSAT